jgi:hypothetical protein
VIYGPWIKCNKCKSFIKSKHLHDFVVCKCGETFVDGGSNYLRAGGHPVMETTGKVATWESEREPEADKPADR